MAKTKIKIEWQFVGLTIQSSTLFRVQHANYPHWDRRLLRVRQIRCSKLILMFRSQFLCSSLCCFWFCFTVFIVCRKKKIIASGWNAKFAVVMLPTPKSKTKCSRLGAEKLSLAFNSRLDASMSLCLCLSLFSFVLQCVCWNCDALRIHNNTSTETVEKRKFNEHEQINKQNEKSTTKHTPSQNKSSTSP